MEPVFLVGTGASQAQTQVGNLGLRMSRTHVTLHYVYRISGSVPHESTANGDSSQGDELPWLPGSNPATAVLTEESPASHRTRVGDREGLASRHRVPSNLMLLRLVEVDAAET
jgi:hypothetical protein